ncbi:MAG: hypothetical protein U0P81_06390 [Holophagaceae bacterium]
MAATLRQLLVQRAARLQGRPALTCAEWGTLSHARLRNRVEGVALGLMARPLPPGTAVRWPGSGPWAWVAEVAAACCGLAWEASGLVLDAEAAGADFNSEGGRGPYHERGEELSGESLFHRGLTQEAVIGRLARLNARLGWDHETAVAVPGAAASTPEGRAALWSALYAGAHAILAEPVPARGGGVDPFDPSAFRGFWEP